MHVLTYVFDASVLATNGCVAYDLVLDSEVLIMSVALCFQADSPMHAAVTNTPNPNVSLNPCQMCQLNSPSLKEKMTERYVEQFLGIDSRGYEVSTVPLVRVRECSNMTVPLSHEVLGAPPDMVRDKVADF
jgi:hypothetical protein